MEGVGHFPNSINPLDATGDVIPRDKDYRVNRRVPIWRRSDGAAIQRRHQRLRPH